MQSVHIPIFARSIDQPIGNRKTRARVEVLERIGYLNLPAHRPGCSVEGEDVESSITGTGKDRIGAGIGSNGGPDTANSRVVPAYIARHLVQRIHRATAIVYQ